MTPFSQLSTNEFRISLSPEQLRTGQIIQLALVVAPVLYLLVNLITAATRTMVPPEEVDVEYVQLLTGIAVGFLPVALIAGRLLYNSRFTEEELKKGEANIPMAEDGTLLKDSPAIRAVAVIRTAMLMQSALSEGAAMLGLVVLTIAAAGGYLLTIPWIWLNALPLTVHTVLILINFPTVDHLTAVYEQKFKQR
ncbi:MAG: hypothetical protein HUU02_08405 [Bacteroidetes bacterium]|nr:hypothetical protein [Bacteroidota bacterium]